MYFILIAYVLLFGLNTQQCCTFEWFIINQHGGGGGGGDDDHHHHHCDDDDDDEYDDDDDGDELLNSGLLPIAILPAMPFFVWRRWQTCFYNI